MQPLCLRKDTSAVVEQIWDMSQHGNFLGGFLAGAAIGGTVGGIIGALLATRYLNPDAAEAEADRLQDDEAKHSLSGKVDASIEVARNRLEDKIAQLNQTIDEVRQQIGSVNNGSPDGEKERSR